MAVGMTDSPQASIGKLLRDNVFEVPPYQRDYRWPVDKVMQLFDDIDAAIARGDDRYFLGLMVFMKSENEESLIVLDGQQRIATIFIFLAACRNWLRLYGDLAVYGNMIDSEFMGHRRYGEDDIRPRLVLNSANNGAFYSYVIQSKPASDLPPALGKMRKHDRSRRLLEAALSCHQRVERLAENGHEECARRIFEIVNFLKEHVPIVNMTVPDEGTAFTIFETLNDRGIDLSPLDLVKNHLFRCVGAGEDARQRDLEARWGQMMYNLEDSAPDQFLKAFWTSCHGRIQTHSLFKQFIKTYSDQRKSMAISTDMLTASERYAALWNPDDPVWADYSKESREHVRSLRILGAQQTHPVILAAFDRLESAEMERLLRLLEVLIVRYQFVGGGRTGALEIECAKVAQGIHDGKIPNAATAFKEFRSVYPSDEAFRTALQDMREASGPKTVYLLKRLEEEARRQATSEPVAGMAWDTDLTVEHVIPKNPDREWAAKVPVDEDDLPGRLGNLCLMKRHANQRLGRAPFSQKKVLYADSDFLLTKGIADYDDWGINEIRRRQDFLAKLGVQAWRFQ